MKFKQLFFVEGLNAQRWDTAGLNECVFYRVAISESQKRQMFGFGFLIMQLGRII